MRPLGCLECLRLWQRRGGDIASAYDEFLDNYHDIQHEHDNDDNDDHEAANDERRESGERHPIRLRLGLGGSKRSPESRQLSPWRRGDASGDSRRQLRPAASGRCTGEDRRLPAGSRKKRYRILP